MAFLPKRRSESGTGGLFSLQNDINSLFNRFLEGREWPGIFGEKGFAPAVDVVETAEEVQVRAEVPGVSADDLDISITGDMLTIKGEKKSEKEEKEENYHLVERSFGSFARSLKLPPYADARKVSADFADGVLTVRFGKALEAAGKTVKVDVK